MWDASKTIANKLGFEITFISDNTDILHIVLIIPQLESIFIIPQLENKLKFYTINKLYNFLTVFEEGYVNITGR